ncbi:MAG TPA: PEGA domain-containing protein [Vicinamibacterales bacterium]
MIPKRLKVVFLACGAAVMVWPSAAAAQPVGHVSVNAGVVVGGGYYRPFYSPSYWGWYPAWYPLYPAYPPYGYWYSGSYSSIRLQVTPKQAEVFIDGYYVGIVDDFDGTFQRLDAPLGQHEIQIYMKGYKTYSEKMLLRPGQSYKLAGVLQPLGPGEAQEPRPEAAAPPQGQYAPQGEYPAPPPGARPPRGERTQPPPAAHEGEPGAQNTGFGTVTIRVQPADAVVVIDGERWDSPEGGSRLQIQLSAGPHHVEISKDGYKTYSASVTVRAGETQTLNVSLATGGALTGAAILSSP